jgi:hypothetical protein
VKDYGGWPRAQMGKPDHWKLVRSEFGHLETPEFRQEIVAFQKRFLWR